LRVVAAWAPGSLLLFTYVHRGVLDGSTAFTDNRRLARVLARAGEPWTFGLEPRDLPAFLTARRLELVEDLGAEDYRARYLGAVGPHQRGYQFYRAALARVPTICA
jgi:O-methyltransferase involved in polyketide biosynthesis